ncbi:ESPR domain-containing protein [Neisseria leonii]|uniref:ESPR domain-containing protein n=1 Tax=Neisseria leonii TaxID=2995413 RepID=UPI00237A4ACF|nr:ESPR domain-containing protein [Neisseria sp. 3986]MDD9325953.1 ESPR domain-containing protein [Neisseria sp. 3986]
MNHIYKVVFNKATGTFTAVAEFAKSQGKNNTVNNSAASTAVKAVKFLKITPLAVAVFAALGFASQANAVTYRTATNADQLILGGNNVVQTADATSPLVVFGQYI